MNLFRQLIALAVTSICLLAGAQLVSSRTYMLHRQEKQHALQAQSKLPGEVDKLAPSSQSEAITAYDSGGCAPLTNWEAYSKPTTEFPEWNRRLVKLSQQIVSLSAEDRKRAVFNALEDNFWIQVIDGRSQQLGRVAFGNKFVEDVRNAADFGLSLLGTKQWLTTETYAKLHELAYWTEAQKENIDLDFRGDKFEIVLPLYEKPFGVHHNIHDAQGNIAFDPALRTIEIYDSPKGWGYNDHQARRWRYHGMPKSQIKSIVEKYFDEFWAALDQTHPSDYAARLRIVARLYSRLDNFHCFPDGNGRTNYLVLQLLLCDIGLHPVSLYNLMESVLCSEEEEYQKVLEGFFKWEEAYNSGSISWTREAVAKRKEECDVAIDRLLGKRQDAGVNVPDTMGGCMCKNVGDCKTNTPGEDGQPWCDTAGSCVFAWDHCAPGRTRQA